MCSSDLDITTMEKIGEAMKKGSLCALGQSTPNPILSSLAHFKDEYLAHIVDKKCPSGTCKDLISYWILEDKCIGCTVCARKCPVGAISGARKEVHVIDQNACTQCGVCYESCRFDAIEIR